MNKILLFENKISMDNTLPMDNTSPMDITSSMDNTLLRNIKNSGEFLRDKETEQEKWGENIKHLLDHFTMIKNIPYIEKDKLKIQNLKNKIKPEAIFPLNFIYVIWKNKIWKNRR